MTHFLVFLHFYQRILFCTSTVCLFFVLPQLACKYLPVDVRWKAIPDTLASTSTPSSSSTLSDQTVATAFAIFTFLQSGHRYRQDVPDEIIHTVNSIVATSRRPADIPTSRGRTTRTSESVEPTQFPAEWALGPDPFASAVRRFHTDTVQYRQTRAYQSFLLIARSPPSADTTPDRPTEQKRSATPEPSTAGAEKPSAPRSERFRHDHVAPVHGKNDPRAPSYSPLTEKSNITSDSNPTTGSNPLNTRRTSETSAEEAIYPHPIGPELPKDYHSMATLDPTIQAAITTAVTAAVAQVAAQFQQQRTATDGTADEGAKRPVIQSSQDIEYFDPTYENPDNPNDTASPIVNNGRHTFYRDVYVFIDRLKDLAAETTGEQRIRELLPGCLKGEALI